MFSRTSDVRSGRAANGSLIIVSGGQSGVDRAALDAALENGVRCGGWCPAGRLAEDGPLPDRYPLRELETGGYAERTLANILESDGTAVIHAGELEGGTLRTVQLCLRHNKPHQLVDSAAIEVSAAVEILRAFIAREHIGTLNVAGPRASKQPRIYGYAFAVFMQLLQRFPRQP